MTDKFISPCPKPTEYEREVLDNLTEEAAEAIQRATKMLRFGRDEIQTGQDLSNRQRLGREIGNFLAMVEIAIETGLVQSVDVAFGTDEKRRKFLKYLQAEPPTQKK